MIVPRRRGAAVSSSDDSSRSRASLSDDSRSDDAVEGGIPIPTGNGDAISFAGLALAGATVPSSSSSSDSGSDDAVEGGIPIPTGNGDAISFAGLALAGATVPSSSSSSNFHEDSGEVLVEGKKGGDAEPGSSGRSGHVSISGSYSSGPRSNSSASGSDWSSYSGSSRMLWSGSSSMDDEYLGLSGTLRGTIRGNDTLRLLKGMGDLLVEGRKMALPSNRKIEFTRTGTPYIVDIKEEKRRGKEAALEHKRHRHLMCMRGKKLEKHFGIGIRMYFDFIQFLTFTNVLLAVLGLISFGLHCYFDRNYFVEKELETNTTGGFRIWDFFNTAGYGKDNRIGYSVLLLLSVLLWFSFPPIHFLRSWFKERKQTYFETVGRLDEIVANRKITPTQRIRRMAAAYVAFFLILLFSSTISLAVWCLRFLPIPAPGGVAFWEVFISLIISCTIFLMNYVWKKICTLLTKFERHSTWSAFRKHNTMKFFFFKVLNVCLLYVVAFVAERLRQVYRESEDQDQTCFLSPIAMQFFALIFMDTFVAAFFECCIPVCWYKYDRFRKKDLKTSGSNDSIRPEFDVAEEYLELLYRQFIVYLGTPVFPLMPFFALFSNVSEYCCDKGRMLYLCRRPHRLNESMRKFLSLYLLIIAVIALFVPPFGSLWMWWGLFDRYDTCELWD